MDVTAPLVVKSVTATNDHTIACNIPSATDAAMQALASPSLASGAGAGIGTGAGAGAEGLAEAVKSLDTKLCGRCADVLAEQV